MARYISHRSSVKPPKATWWGDWESATPQALPNPQLAAPEAVDTGLVDADGNRIMRLPDQIGFVREHSK